MRTWMPKPSPTLLIGLKKCVEATVAFVGKKDNFCPKVKKQEKGGETSWRSIRWSPPEVSCWLVLITSKTNDDLESLITPEKELKESLAFHVQTLCLAKLNAKLPEEEIQSCYCLKDGNIKLTLANLSLTSAFNKMVKNPDAEREKDKPVFQLHGFWGSALLRLWPTKVPGLYKELKQAEKEVNKLEDELVSEQEKYKAITKWLTNLCWGVLSPNCCDLDSSCLPPTSALPWKPSRGWWQHQEDP